MIPLENYHKSFMQSVYSNDDLETTDTLSSLFNNSYDTSSVMDRISRPTSFNTSSLFSDYGNADVASPLGNSMTSIGTFTDGSTPATPTSAPVKNPKLYKTELCRSWVDSGRCNYGDRCQYAHGESEKRAVPRHPKYKTEACQSFHQSGYCPYGARCHFIHNESEYSQNRQASQLSSPIQTPSSIFGNNTSRMNNFSSSVLQRVYSHPGYGSSGESPAGSSNDSGSESPNGSFSPALDLDEHSAFGLSAFASSTPKVNRFNSFDPMNATDDLPYNILSGLLEWSLDEKKPSKEGRLPVFAQLSNPQ